MHVLSDFLLTEISRCFCHFERIVCPKKKKKKTSSDIIMCLVENKNDECGQYLEDLSFQVYRLMCSSHTTHTQDIVRGRDVRVKERRVDKRAG